MKMRILAVGSRQPAWVDTAVSDYLGRLAGSHPTTLTEIRAEKRAAGLTPELIKKREGQRLLDALDAHDTLIVLDERGEQPDTAALADWLRTFAEQGHTPVFAIGGADGHGDAVLARARKRLGLSRLTLPHGLARVILAEQLYRACSLLAGHPYHRE
jgi:23S rRNA (pseudouridine1915-N3)-methyltransferase